ncbi:MAG: signal peptidase I [Parasporobacterium sp.]|nr:signal peptidase I [Parasporobacterium sp.]
MNKKTKQLLFFLLRIFTVAAFVFLILTFIVTPRLVRGNNMYPSLKDGQLVLIFRPGRVLKDSIVLYRDLEGEEKIGRVIGEAADVVEIQDESGILLNENLLIRRIPYPVPAGDLDYPYHIPEESFFLVNDYREDTEDSRSFGAVSKEKIVGVVVFALQYRDF